MSEDTDIPDNYHSFARKEFSDALEALDDENYASAALFVFNARAEIRDYGKVDYGPVMERFDEIYDEYMREIAKSGASKSFLRDYDTYDNVGRSQDVDDDFLRTQIDKLQTLERQMNALSKEWNTHFGRHTKDNPEITDEFESRHMDLDELICIRCGDNLLGKFGSALEELPGRAGLCRECFYYLTTVRHEEPHV